MTKKEALTTFSRLLAGLYGTAADATRVAGEAGLNVVNISTNDKPVNYWWNILVEAHKRNRVEAISKNAVYDWSERAGEIKSAYEAYSAAPEGDDPIDPIGASGVGARTAINTGGGAYIGGGVTLGGGDFTGRDKIVHGDEVRGDKVGGDKNTVGNITGSSGVVIGRGTATVTTTTGLSGSDLNQLFAPLMAAVQAAPPEKKEEAMQKTEALKNEAAKGKNASDETMTSLIEGLVALVPGAVSAVVSAFASPLLGGVAGPVTSYLLRKIGAKQP